MIFSVLFNRIQTNQNQTKQTKGPNVNKGIGWRYLGCFVDVLQFFSSLLINMPIFSVTLECSDVGKSGCMQQRGKTKPETHSRGW